MVRTYAFNPSTQSAGEGLPCTKPQNIPPSATANFFAHSAPQKFSPNFGGDNSAPFAAAGRFATPTQPRRQFNANSTTSTSTANSSSFRGGQPGPQSGPVQHSAQIRRGLTPKLRQTSLTDSDHFSASLNSTASSLPSISTAAARGRLLPAGAKFNGQNAQITTMPLITAASNQTVLLPTPTIVEDATTLMGIRCVRINGQRFYQPLDLRNPQQRTQQQTHQQQNGSVTSESANSGMFESQRTDVESCSQDSGYQCSLDTIGESPLSERSKTEAFSTAISLVATGEQNPAKVERRNAQRDFAAAPAERSPRQTLTHHKSDFELSRPARDAMFEPADDTNSLPWARGNPQPRDGKRGSPGWALTSAAPFDAHSQDAFGAEKSDGGHRPLSLSNSYGAFYAEPTYYAQSALNLTQFANNAEQREKFAKEQHKLELLRQIEDNKRRKMLEKQREWENEERERVKNELYQQRIRLEMEDEKRKEREKELIAERKAQRIAAAQKAAAELLEQQHKQKEQQRLEKQQRQKRQQAEDGGGLPASEEQPNANNRAARQRLYSDSEERENRNDGSEPAEWWERSARLVDRLKSPVIPALRNAQERQNSPAIPTFAPNARQTSKNRSDINYKNDKFHDDITHKNDITQKPPIQSSRLRQNAKYHRDISYEDENFQNDSSERVPRPFNQTYNKYDNTSPREDTVKGFDESARSSSNFSAPPTPPPQRETRRRVRQRSDAAAARHAPPSENHFGRRLFEGETADDEAASRSSADIRENSQRMRARSYSRSSRRSYQSSIEAAAADARRRKFSDSRSDSAESRLAGSPAMRRLNGTQRNLRRENKRVRAALRSNNYGAHIFDE